MNTPSSIAIPSKCNFCEGVLGDEYSVYMHSPFLADDGVTPVYPPPDFRCRKCTLFYRSMEIRSFSSAREFADLLISHWDNDLEIWKDVWFLIYKTRNVDPKKYVAGALASEIIQALDPSFLSQKAKN